jgi:hypothetical protein
MGNQNPTSNAPMGQTDIRKEAIGVQKSPFEWRIAKLGL